MTEDVKDKKNTLDDQTQTQRIEQKPSEQSEAKDFVDQLIKEPSNQIEEETVSSSTLCQFGLTDQDKENAKAMANERRILNDRFLLEEIIGVGGMGVVYRAIDKVRQRVQKNNCYVAIKVLSREVRKHKEAFLALQRETYKEQQFAHPNILKVYDFNQDQDVVYKVMELVKGEHVKSWIKRKFNTTTEPEINDAYIEEVTQIVKKVAQGLYYVHKKRIVHSDLKPSNIFLTDDGEVKVFDFGIARTIKQEDFSNQNEDETIFDPMTFAAFTPKYASYEMLSRQEPSACDDIYALGCILYEMFKGEHPFGGKNAKIVLEESIEFNEIDSLPIWLNQLLKQMLQVKKSNRIQSMSEVIRLLDLKDQSEETKSIVTNVKAVAVKNKQSKKAALSFYRKKRFIIPFAILFGALDCYLIYKAFKPTIEKAIAPTVYSCKSVLSGKFENAKACYVTLDANSDHPVKLNMQAYHFGNEKMAVMDSVLNNQQAASFGVQLTDKEQLAPKNTHYFDQSGIQMFYLQVVSKDEHLSLLSPQMWNNIFTNDKASLCGGIYSNAKGVNWAGSNYAETVTSSNLGFYVMQSKQSASSCQILETPLNEVDPNRLLTTRLVWKL